MFLNPFCSLLFRFFFPLANQTDVLEKMTKMASRIEELSNKVERMQNDGLGEIEKTPDVECPPEEPGTCAEESPAQLEAKEVYIELMQAQADKINKTASEKNKRKKKAGEKNKEQGNPKKKPKAILPRDLPLTDHLKKGILDLMSKWNEEKPRKKFTVKEVFKHMRAVNDSQFKVPMGSQVRKDFDGEIHCGTVQKFYDEDCSYEVLYEDGEKEDMDLHDLKAFLVDATVIVRPVIEPPPFPTEKRVKNFVENWKKSQKRGR